MRFALRVLLVLALLSAFMAAWQNGSLTSAKGIREARAIGTTDPASLGTKQLAKLTAHDGAAGDGLGGGIAMDGNTLAVGAPADDNGRGVVYVYVKPAGGWQTTSTYAAKLVASDGAAGDQFGAPIAMRGETIVVGAHVADVNGNVDQGAAYVFVKPKGGWHGTLTESAKLTTSNGAANDLFSVQADVDETGEVIVVGAHHVDGSRGAAYVFVKPAGGWSGHLNENARLSVSDGAPGDFFGRGLGISGDTIAVGAYGVNGWSGRAYVFVKPAGGWTGTVYESARLDKLQGGYAEFGSTVEVKGDTVVVGAYTEEDWRGAAYVYVKPAGGWKGSLTENSRLIASDRDSWDFFGYEGIALRDDLIVVGAHQDDAGANIDQGSVYLFDKPAAGWHGNLTETDKLTARDGAEEDWFGIKVAMGRDTIAIGAPQADIGAKPNQGAVYVFRIQPSAQAQADLALVKKVSTRVTRSKSPRFVLRVRNLGPDRADTVTITDTLPDGIQFIKATSQNAKCTFIEQLVTCTLDTLDADENMSIRLRVRYLGEDEMPRNCAEAHAATLDPNPGNNEACVE